MIYRLAILLARILELIATVPAVCAGWIIGGTAGKRIEAVHKTHEDVSATVTLSRLREIKRTSVGSQIIADMLDPSISDVARMANNDNEPLDAKLCLGYFYHCEMCEAVNFGRAESQDFDEQLLLEMAQQSGLVSDDAETVPDDVRERAYMRQIPYGVTCGCGQRHRVTPRFLSKFGLSPEAIASRELENTIDEWNSGWGNEDSQ